MPWAMTDTEYQLTRLNYLGIKPSAMFIDTDQLEYDPATGFWVAKQKVCEPAPETIRKCDCGSSSGDPTHYTWCQTVQNEDR
jgi:hypothetical protein